MKIIALSLAVALSGSVVHAAPKGAMPREVVITGAKISGAEYQRALRAEGILDVMPGVMAAQAEMHEGTLTSETLVKRYLARIAKIDQGGLELRSLIAINPQALEDARKLDAERKAGHVRGPLHGVPVLLKDNIESDEGMATTAGSLALKDNVNHRDAPLVARLKAAGAVILGKTNLSEWANIRSTHSTSGWSGVGGLVKNPYALDRSACGSSSGTGAAIAASLASAGVGSETDGSVTCPSSVNGLVGIKPTVGLVSRTYIVPISHSQDTAGPMGRSVEDVAAMLTAMAGSDPKDSATAEADRHKRDYLRDLAPDALNGKRIGVLRDDLAGETAIAPLYEAALARLKAAGAILVEVKYPKDADVGHDEQMVLGVELKADLNAYLASTNPAKVKTRTLADVIAFNEMTPRETALFGQELFLAAQTTKGLDDPAYKAARERSMTTARRAIDETLAEAHLDALVIPTTGPAWRVDIATGDHDSGSSTTLPAVAGYPHLTVPMGQIHGLPIGLSFIGPAWSEGRLLAYGFAYQQQGGRFTPPTYRLSVESTEAAEAAFKPVR